MYITKGIYKNKKLLINNLQLNFKQCKMLQPIIIVLISIILYIIINCIRRIDKIDSKFILTQNNKSVLLHIDNKRIVLMPYKGLKLYKSIGLFKSNYHSLYNEKDNINKDTKEVFIFKSIKDIEKITKNCEEDENLLNFIRLSYREYIITKHQLS